jgi:hypothetical protein
MPWKEINLMDQRLEFVHRALTKLVRFRMILKDC